MARRPASEQGDTLQRVRAAAFALFGRFGHDGVSMLQVAKDAGITKAALYWHFESKEALYLDCQLQLFRLFEQHVLERMHGVSRPADQLLTMFDGVVSLLGDPRIRAGIAGYWMIPSTLKGQAAARSREQFEQNYSAFLSRVIAGAVADGSLRADVNVDDLARAVMVVQEGIVLPLREESAQRTQRLIDVMAYTLLRAYASDELADEFGQRLQPQP